MAAAGVVVYSIGGLRDDPLLVTSALIWLHVSLMAAALVLVDTMAAIEMILFSKYLR